MAEQKDNRSPRNKTVQLANREIEALLAHCVGTEQVPAHAFTDSAVICGDTFTVLPLLPAHKFGLLIADPPYNLRKDYGGNVFQPGTYDEYVAFTLKWLSLCLPLLTVDASVYVCCDYRCSSAIERALVQAGLTVSSRITWQREKGRGAAHNWKNAMEDIWFATVSDAYTFHLDAVRQRKTVLAPYREDGRAKDWTQGEHGERFRDTCPSNFWDDITVPYWSMPENTPHPTQKPEKLLAKLILASSNAGDFILDPFLGSGSTLSAAEKLGRACIGIEQCREYCAYAALRQERARADKRIQGYEDGIFYARNYRKD